MQDFGNFIILFFYTILWCFTYWYTSKKYGQWSIGTIMILLYFLISLVSYFIYFSPNANQYFENKLTLIPFLYLFIALILAIYPLFNFSLNKVTYIALPKYKYLNLICFLFSTFAIISLIKIIPLLKSGIIGLILDSSEAADIYATSTYSRMNQSNASGFDVLSILGNTSKSIVPLLFFCYLIQRRKNKVIMIMLTISLLITPLQGIANASRLNIITSFMIIIFLSVFFYPFLSNNIKIHLKKGAIGLTLFFSVFFLLISIGRSSGSASSFTYSLLRYLGESPIVFDNYCMNAGGTREGEYTFAFQHILDRKNQPNETELRDRFRNLKIDSSRFYTFVGDFVLDYGPLNASLIFLIVFLFMYNKTKIKRRTITFPQLLLLFILIIYCSGFYQYQFSMKAGNTNLFILLFLYFFTNTIFRRERYYDRINRT